MNFSDTIAAISTAHSPGGIGIVRISGEKARQIADAVFKSKKGTVARLLGYTALYGGVYDGEEKIDEAVALMFASPKSYTGEDVVELSCHGGTAVMKRVLRAVIAAGARQALPGEFTRRAFENGKVTLTEAEAVMALVSAAGMQAERVASAAKGGALYRRISNIKDELTDITAWLAAWSDFPEEDIPAVEPEALTKRLGMVGENIKELIDGFDTGRIQREGIKTVIAGRPNVGKSTLMNLITGHESSIITDIPGTTRDVVSEQVTLFDVPLILSDTAGLRSSCDTVEQIGVRRAREMLEGAQLIIAVFDSSKELTHEDIKLLEYCSGRSCVAVINKSDLENKLSKEAVERYIKHTVTFSAKNADSADELGREIVKAVNLRELDPDMGILFNERQLDCAKRAYSELENAISATKNGVTLDAVTVMCESSLDALLELSGERITDAVADAVFSHFCVGK